MREEFHQVIDAYAALPNKPLEIAEQQPNYAQLRGKGWYKGLHYEFLDMPGKENNEGYLSVEIHIEVKSTPGLVEVLKSWCEDSRPLLQDILMSKHIDWDGEWPFWTDWNTGRIMAAYPYGNPQVVAEAMARFISATEPRITEWLKTNNRLKAA